MRALNPLLSYPRELEEGMHQFQEIFIEYYGEEHRKEIEEVFKKLVPIGYQTPKIISQILASEEINLTNTLMNEVIEKSRTQLSKSVLLDNSSFLKYYKNHPIFLYGLLRESYHLGREGRLKRFFMEGFEELKKSMPNLTWREFQEMVETQTLTESCKEQPYWLQENIKYYIDASNEKAQYKRLYKRVEQLLKKVNPDISFETLEDNFDSFKELDEILAYYIQALKEYRETMEGYKEWTDEKERMDQIEHDLKEKYYKRLLRESMDLIPEELREGVNKYLDNSRNLFLVDKKVTNLLGTSLGSYSDLEAFQKQNEEAITNYNGRNSLTKSIIERRIHYFNERGIQLGNDYQAYVDSKEAQAIWPDASRVEQFIEEKRECLNDLNLEYFPMTKDYQEAQRKLSVYDFLDKENVLTPKTYNQETICIESNIIEKDGHYELIPVLYINFNLPDWEFFDHYLVHEINHIIELHLLGTTPRSYTYSSGWEVFEEGMRQEEAEKVDTLTEAPKREYELFNEAINEMIAQEISKMMVDRGIHIFNHPTKLKYQYSTSYDRLLHLARPFFEEFREAILKSRRNGNIDIILETVGKENFDALNELINKEFKSREKGTLIEERDKIMERMRSHSQKEQGEYFV